MSAGLVKLLLLQRPCIFKSPDASDIWLGPQKFDRNADKNGPGSVAAARFYPGASSALMHKTVSEKWFYAEGPDFYMWLCPDDKPMNKGTFYKITAGTKIEIPPRTKFQIYNPSEELVQVLLVVNPFWPQDDSVRDEIAFPTGPWQRQTVCHYKPDVVTQEYKDNIYDEDPIAQASSTGFEYVQKALASIGYDVNEFAIAGDSWYVYSKEQPLFKPLPYPEGAKVNVALNGATKEQMTQHIKAHDNYIGSQLALGAIEFEIGLNHYNEKNFEKAAVCFVRSRQLGDKNAAFYEGLLKEYGHGCEVNPSGAIACYQWAATLGHYGAFTLDGRLHSTLENQSEKVLALIADEIKYQAQEKVNSKGLQEHGGLMDSNDQDEDATHEVPPK